MRRSGIALALIVVCGVAAAAFGYWKAREHADPVQWLCHEFALQDDQAGRVRAISAEYESHCREMCERIAASNERVAQLVREARSVTPEIRDALAETDALRTECRTKMLEHFFRIAEELPSAQRDKYLSVVLPSVVQPGEMERAHH